TPATARSRRPAPRPRREAPQASAARRVDVRGWLGGLRLSGFTVIMMGLVILAVCVLVPTVSTYVGQRQQIAALQHSVQMAKDDVAALDQERERWKNPAYIASEARERLYYVKPGDIVYLVIDDLPASRLPQQQDAVSKGVQQTKTDWTSQLVASVVQAGTARIAVTK
ncbi:MAG TPA: septum formation initiator family protein, partial [Microbacterium sp.]|nr:septum formation initiator family protein [Microbacterium sp.]